MSDMFDVNKYLAVLAREMPWGLDDHEKLDLLMDYVAEYGSARDFTTFLIDRSREDMGINDGVVAGLDEDLFVAAEIAFDEVGTPPPSHSSLLRRF